MPEPTSAPKPSRNSSEAPEVVPGQFLPTDSLSPIQQPQSAKTPQLSPQLGFRSEEVVHSRASSWLSYPKSRLPEGVEGPQFIHDDAVRYQVKVHSRSRRVFGLLNVVILVVIAFFVGGGIGGGVVGAIVGKSPPMKATSSSASQSTVIIDAAGCPLINNSTYTSPTGPTFLTLCSTTILPASGQNIDLSNSVQSSFDACLDTCAKAKGCVGASWYMFDPQSPSRNSVCFLKNGTGEEGVISGGTSVVSGWLRGALG